VCKCVHGCVCVHECVCATLKAISYATHVDGHASPIAKLLSVLNRWIFCIHLAHFNQMSIAIMASTVQLQPLATF